MMIGVDPYMRVFVTKIAAARRRLHALEAQKTLRTITPQLAHAYAAFASRNQSGSARQPFKGWDVWRILEASQPRSIAELGSGTTSAVFALWAKRHSATYIAYEHDSHWAAVTQSCLEEAGLVEVANHIRTIPIRIRGDHGATGFVEPLPVDIEFVYVDGPPCMLEGRKVPNDDIVRLFDVGGSPRTIVVDGRVETVDLIRSHRAATEYRFSPGLVYCLRRGIWSGAMAGREHSLFVRR